uniref:Collagen type XIV alpha 1 chain n=1 Tax=Sander lucioperca TaxID=283035 RepID=A0A8C9ZLQ8_SANLU
MCKTPAVSDIVILVDGSWSIGRINFRLVRTFLENLVKAFSVEFDKTRIGLAQYSGDPRIEWHLNAHTTKEAVMEAVKNLPYKGGNTLTGLALTFILENSFKPESGSRPGVPKIGILITDGKSQDDVIPPAQSLREAGIELFAIGVKNADENELKAIASPPEETHVYNVADFSVMSDIVDGLTKTVCERQPARPPTAVEAPRDLVTSEVTARSFRVRWTHAPGQVEKYRVVYYPASGGKPEEKVVQGTENSVELTYLNSLTEYQVAVFAVYHSSASEALRGSATTLALPMVNDLELFDITHSTMRVRWKIAAGASGYMILYAPLTEGDPADEKEVKVEDSVNEVELEGLTPATEYTVTVYALYGEEASDPMTSHFSNVLDRDRHNISFEVYCYHSNHTCVCLCLCVCVETVPDPPDLKSSDISTDSFRVSWQHPASDVVMYRLTWTPTDGGDSEEVLVNGNINTYLIKGLSPVTEYEVLLAAIYMNEVESDEVVLVESTGKCNLTATSGLCSIPSLLTTADNRAQQCGSGSKTPVHFLHKDFKLSAIIVIVCTLSDPPAPRFGVRNLRIDEETTFSMRVAWQPGDSRNVRHYRLSYISAKGDRAEEQRTVPTGQNSLILQPLLSDTEYKVAITPVYPDGDGPTVARMGRTLPLSAPRNLRLSEEWYNRFRISWDAPPSPTMGYRVVYQPVSAPGSALETFVGEDVNTMLIVNLLSGTEYSVKVIASYTTGSSEALSGRAKTLYLGVTNLSAYQVRMNSFCAQWQPHRHANAYRVTIESLLSEYTHTKQETKLSGGANRHCFNNLKANTQYKMSVYAQLQDGSEGPAVTVTEKTRECTDRLQTATEMKLKLIPLLALFLFVSVCKAAKADLVFLVDGSWSIGDDNFLKIIRFLYSTSGALDRIGPDGTQVAIAQFSDDARTEFKLNSYGDKERLLDAINKISYKGGNTKTGRAIQHVKENIFTAEGGMRRGIPNVLVVLTDGRSQDDVNKVSKEMQMEGYIVFAIGFADADYGELVSIASKPSDRHVFFVDDLDAFTKIEEKLVTFVCEAATATCPSVPMSGSTTPGFRMMELFGLVENRYGSVSGVSMVPGTFNTFPCFHLHSNALMAQPTRFIHPEGLPSDYTITLLFRLLPDTPEEPFALWEILNKNNEPLVGVILDNGGKSLTFFNNDYKGEFQTVTFEGPEIKKLFYGSFHKVRISPVTSAKVVIDCKMVAEKTINAAGNITIDGTEVLGRMVRSRGNKDNSFQLQIFDIVCSTSWASRDKCCELPGLVRSKFIFSLNLSLLQFTVCTQIHVKRRLRPQNEHLYINHSQGVGPTGPVGDTGVPGPQGPQGPQGPSGRSIIGPPVRQTPNTATVFWGFILFMFSGHMARYNSILNHVPSPPVSIRTVPGPPGEPGRQGSPGPQGEQGPTGRPGFPGQNGQNGQPGERGKLVTCNYRKRML